MKATRFLALLVTALLCISSADAAIPNTVPVGNPGNAPYPNGVGAVSYKFFIGKTEISNAQYTAFLNAVAAIDSYELYNPLMGSETWGGIFRIGSPGSFSYLVKPAAPGGYAYGDKPVVYVSSGDAMRYANWLHNGMPTGPQNHSTTEDGAYSLNGATSAFDLVAVTRNTGARWWLPNEDEWFKAAYHKNDGVTGNYWDYPTGADSAPNNNPPSADTGNSGNFYDLINDEYTTGDASYPMTNAGAYTMSDGPYGTFDQGGNVWEWTETVSLDFGFQRISKGGSWDSSSEGSRTVAAAYGDASFENFSFGFRVASIPEPASITLCIAILMMLMLHPAEKSRGVPEGRR